MKFQEIKRRLEAAGWVEKKGGKSGHRHFENIETGAKVTLPCHSKDMNKYILKNIEQITGVNMN